MPPHPIELPTVNWNLCIESRCIRNDFGLSFHSSKIIFIDDSLDGYFLFLTASILKTLCPYRFITLWTLGGVQMFPLSVFIPQELNLCAILL